MTRKIIYIILFLLTSCGYFQKEKQPEHYTTIYTIYEWQEKHISNRQVFQEGKIVKLLEDDNEGSRHQKFIVQLYDDRTSLLVSHNIDIATRIPDLEIGKAIQFYGEYEWNNKGGVVHWTHKDPKGNHPDGFLLYKGKKYN